VVMALYNIELSTSYSIKELGLHSHYSDLQWAGRSDHQIPLVVRFFHTRPDQPWGPPSFLCNGYQVSFLEVKHLGCGIDDPPPSSAEVKGSVEIHL